MAAEGRRICAGVGISLAVHAALAVGLVLYLGVSREHENFPQLDLTSVELSFAERDAVTETVAPMPLAPPSEEVKPSVDEPPPPPDVELPPPDLSSEPDFPQAREKPEPMPEVERPPVKDPPPDKEPESREEPVSEKVVPTAAPPVPAVAPQQARLDAPPRPRRTIRPKYPRGARERGEQGEVTLELVVGADGGVTDVRVIRTSGFAELDEAAVRAVREAHFRPAEAAGRPVEATATLSLRFKLN